MDGGSNQQAYHHVFLLIFDYDGPADYCLADIYTHTHFLVLYARTPVSVYKLANYHLLVLLCQFIILVLVIITNYEVLAVPTIVTQKVKILVLWYIFLEFQ